MLTVGASGFPPIILLAVQKPSGWSYNLDPRSLHFGIIGIWATVSSDGAS